MTTSRLSGKQVTEATVYQVVAAERQALLLGWIAESEAHNGLTAREAADVSGIYYGHGRQDRCFDDLKRLEKQGHVYRAGRPARWYVGSTT